MRAADGRPSGRCMGQAGSQPPPPKKANLAASQQIRKAPSALDLGDCDDTPTTHTQTTRLHRKMAWADAPPSRAGRVSFIRPVPFTHRMGGGFTPRARLPSYFSLKKNVSLVFWF